MKYIYTYLLFSLICFSCKAQSGFVYQKVNLREYFSDTTSISLFVHDYNEVLKNGYNIEKSLPIGFVKDGTIDYTREIQKAIDQYSILIFPSFPLLISDIGLDFHSNSKIAFQKGSKVLLRQSSKTHYQIFRIWDVKNIQLFFPVIIGDRKSHIGKSGEWGMGISISDAENVLIFAPKVSECWGDGLYITGKKTPSKNIKIYNGWFDYNRRNGISIISAKNLQLINVISSNTFGTNPMSGIDIEPNKNINVIDSFYLKNIYTINNYKVGIKIQLRTLLRNDYSPLTNIKILNHFSEGSDVSVMLTKVLKIDGRFSGKALPINGSIIFENPHWQNFERKALGVWKYGQLGPDVIVVSPKVFLKRNTNAVQLNSIESRDIKNNSKMILQQNIQKENKVKLK